MIKGWKNKPEWVKYYEERDKSKREAILAAIREEADSIQREAMREDLIKRKIRERYL